MRALINVLQGVKNGRDYPDTGINAGRSSAFDSCPTSRSKACSIATGQRRWRKWRKPGRPRSCAEAGGPKAGGQVR
jgi:hypothetical protein